MELNRIKTITFQPHASRTVECSHLVSRTRKGQEATPKPCPSHSDSISRYVITHTATMPPIVIIDPRRPKTGISLHAEQTRQLITQNDVRRRGSGGISPAYQRRTDERREGGWMNGRTEGSNNVYSPKFHTRCGCGGSGGKPNATTDNFVLPPSYFRQSYTATGLPPPPPLPLLHPPQHHLSCIQLPESETASQPVW